MAAVDTTKSVVVIDFNTFTWGNSYGVPLDPYINRTDSASTGELHLTCRLKGLLVPFDFKSIPKRCDNIDTETQNAIFEKVFAAYHEHYSAEFKTSWYNIFRLFCDRLESVKKNGLKLYIATNAVQDQVDRYLQTIPWNDGTLRDLFDGIKGTPQGKIGTPVNEINIVPMLDEILAEVGTTKRNFRFITNSLQQFRDAYDAGYLFTFNTDESEDLMTGEINLHHTNTILLDILDDTFGTIGFDERVMVKNTAIPYNGSFLIGLYGEKFIPYEMHLWLQTKEKPRTLFAKKDGDTYTIGSLCHFHRNFNGGFRYQKGFTKEFQMYDIEIVNMDNYRIVKDGEIAHVYVKDNDVELFGFKPLIYPSKVNFMTYGRSIDDGKVCVMMGDESIIIPPSSYADAIFCVIE
uniref:Uncharacterized protein n=1 Tax=viral metagenome TaxID=1070528 RepID=A0A6C0EBG0_9ZZZZ